MRRVLLGLLAIAAMVVGWLLPAGDAAAFPGKLYVALGDSVTQFGSTSGLRYPERFFAYLQQPGAADTLQNIGVPGETSSSILGGQLTQALQLINDPATNTTVVTLDIGGNDFLANPSCNPTSLGFSLDACQPTLAAFATNYTSLLDQLNQALANEPAPHQVIVMTYYNSWSGRPGEETAAANADLALLGADTRIDCGASGTALGLNDLIACIGAQHGALVADVYPSFVGKGAVWFADEIHPNDIGHAAIASVFASVFGPPADTTTTSVSCSPGSVVAGSSTTCTVAVTDSTGHTTPTGSVSFSSSGEGGFTSGSCGLLGTGASASCSVSYTPSAVGSGTHTLTASYGSDAAHKASSGTTSVTVQPVGPAPPSNISLPRISGRAVQGHVLTEVSGSWTNSPRLLAYQWEECNRVGFACSAIGGASNRALVLSAADVGHTIRVQESATNAAGTGGPATSSATVVVTPRARQIKAQLLKDLRPRGGAERIAALLRQGGYVLSFKALTAGKAKIAWYYLSRGAPAAIAKPKPVLVATGSRTFGRARPAKIKIKLTTRGRQLLSNTAHVKITANGTFTPTHQHIIRATRRFTLTR